MVTSRRSRIPPFEVMEVMEAAARLERAGRRVMHLEVGQPSTPAPRTVLDAAARALQSDVLGYTVATGVPPLRDAIAAHYRRTHGVEVDPARIVVTTGSSGAFLLAFISAFDAGDRVVVAAPAYPCYRNILQALDVEVIPVPCGPETRYDLTAAMLDAHGPVDGVIVASPSNPTGSMIEEAEFRAIAQWCEAEGAALISDEIYHGITYGRPGLTAASFAPEAYVINSFSKYFSMTGWRVGWMIAPEEAIRPVEKLMQNLFISAPTLAQLAAVAAFDATEELDGHVRRYAANRDIILSALPAMGIERIAPPDGAFYIYADVSHLTDDTPAWCARLLETTGVAITPGVDFDRARGQRAIRLSYATDTQSVADAMAAMQGFID